MVGTTALIIMGIAQAGSAIAKAKIESNAAKKATEAQTSAAGQAMTLNRQIWGQQQQNMQPYQQVGGQAAAMLGALNTPGGYNPNKPPVYQAPGPNTLTPFSPGLTPGSNGPAPLSNNAPLRVPQPSTPMPLGPGGVTPRMASGQPLNPFAMRA